MDELIKLERIQEIGKLNEKYTKSQRHYHAGYDRMGSCKRLVGGTRTAGKGSGGWRMSMLNYREPNTEIIVGQWL